MSSYLALAGKPLIIAAVITAGDAARAAQARKAYHLSVSLPLHPLQGTTSAWAPVRGLREVGGAATMQSPSCCIVGKTETPLKTHTSGKHTDLNKLPPKLSSWLTPKADQAVSQCEHNMHF